MKRLTLILMTVLLIATGVMAGCTGGKSEEEKLLEELAKESSISGTYVCTEGGEKGYGHTVDSYYEFNSDGTFYIGLCEGGGGNGEWKLEGDEITIMYPWGGALKGKIKDNTIVLDDGSTWVKEGKRVKEETTTPAPAPAPATSTTTLLEAANFNLSELIELRKVIEEVMTSARLIANEEERRLLSQADVVLGAMQPDSKLHNLITEKTEEDRLILDVLEGIFRVGVQQFYNIPSPIAWAIGKGAEELGNRIAEWQVLGYLGFATLTEPDSGVMEIVYYKEQGEVWVNFYVHNPVGRVCMYIPVEPRLVSPEGGGNIILSEGVRPVMEKCRIAYRLGTEIMLDPTSGPVSTEVQITGTGFAVNENINIKFDGDDLEIEEGGDEIGSDGGFQSIVIIPESTAGEHSITIIIGRSEVEAQFTVEPQITITPISGTKGDTVAVTGTGFGDEQDVAITFNDATVATNTTDQDGSFTVSFSVPDVVAAIYDVDAEDDDNNDATAQFTVEIVTNLTISPVTTLASPAHAGTNIAVSGSAITVTDLTSGLLIATTTSNVDGVFQTTPEAAGATGEHVIIVSDGTTTKQFTFTVIVESIPLPAPAPSLHTHLLFVLSSRFQTIADLKPVSNFSPEIGTVDVAGMKDVPSFEWVKMALATYGIEAERLHLVDITGHEPGSLLETGVVDAILVTEAHPWAPLTELVASGQVKLLPWSNQAIEAVVRAFPQVTMPAYIPPYTYEGQTESVVGFAPRKD